MKMLLRVLICAALFFLCSTAVLANEDPSPCVACHSSLGGELARPVTKWKGSVHDQNGIACDDCHGGNAAVELGNLENLSGKEFAEKQAAAMSQSDGFIGIPSGREMFDMCGQCHDDSVARYADSIMGRAFLDGKGGPSCVACHNAHDNIMPEVPKSCESCHKDTTGFADIDPMNVTEATISELARIRIDLAEKKTKGTKPSLAPGLPEDMDTYQIGLLAFGAVSVLYLCGWLVYTILERRS